jgi:hypothetical protein
MLTFLEYLSLQQLSFLAILLVAFVLLITEWIRNERNPFELSYATRLNRAVGLYFGGRP